jgi:hypothetical protein
MFQICPCFRTTSEIFGNNWVKSEGQPGHIWHLEQLLVTWGFKAHAATYRMSLLTSCIQVPEFTEAHKHKMLVIVDSQRNNMLSCACCFQQDFF